MTSLALQARQNKGYFSHEVEPSATLAVKSSMNLLKGKGVDTISLGAGELQFDLPADIGRALSYIPSQKNETPFDKLPTELQATIALEASANSYSGNSIQNFTPETKRHLAKIAEQERMPPLSYTDASGILPLRMGIAIKQREDYGIDYDPDTQILVSHGGKGAELNLYNAFFGGQATNEKYDGANQSILPTPFWLSHPIMLNSFGGEPKYVECPAEQNYKITAAQLEEAITWKTKLLTITNPNNPSGMIYSERELEELAAVIRRNPHLTVMTEDMYEHYRYDGNPIIHLLNVAPDLADQIVSINCFSKSDEMPGGRTGYATGPADIIKPMKALNSHTLSNAAVLEQWASVAALVGYDVFKDVYDNRDNPKKIKDIMTSDAALQDFRAASALRQEKVPILQARRDLVLSALEQTRLIVPKPEGSFYIFPTVPDSMIGLRFPDDLPLAPGLTTEHLKEEAFVKLGLRSMAGQKLTSAVDFVKATMVHRGVGLVPGKDFGAKNGFRISYAAPDHTMKDAADRIVTLENTLS